MDFLIKQAVPQDALVIAVAAQMWDSNTLEGLTEEFKEYLGQGEKVGFSEVNRVSCFVKKLGETS